MFMQFDNSTRLHALSKNILEFFDISDEIEFFGKKIYDIYTAEGSGLDWWGAKLGVSRLLQITATDTTFIGFEGQGLNNFNQSRFYVDNELQYWEVADDVYRLMLLLRFSNLFADASIPQFQKTLEYIFDNRGTVLLQDNYDMTFDLYVNFDLHIWESYVLQDRKLMPIPMGVSFRLFIVTADEIIGFEGQNLRNFNQSRFLQF